MYKNVTKSLVDCCCLALATLGKYTLTHMEMLDVNVIEGPIKFHSKIDSNRFQKACILNLWDGFLLLNEAT